MNGIGWITVAEAARLCGRPQKTVEAQVFRAKTMLAALDTPLDAFGLSQRIVRACRELGVFTVEHLLVHLRRFRFSRLYCVRNFGSGSAAETLRRLRQDGLTDGGSPRDFKVLYP